MGKIFCTECGVELDDSYIFYSSSPSDLQAHLEKMENIFEMKKAQTIKNCYDWERNTVKSSISEIESIDFVETWDEEIIIIYEKYGFYLESTLKNLLSLLKTREIICKDKIILRKICHNCARSPHDVQVHLEKMENYFKMKKSQTIIDCCDWERDIVKSSISEIESIDFVETWNKEVFLLMHDELKYRDSTLKNLLSLLKARDVICKDKASLKKR